MSLTRARPSAGLLLLVAPVASGRVDVVGADDFAGVEVGDGHGGGVDERDDAFATVSDADAEVMHAAGVAQAHLPVLVDAVVAEPVVTFPGCGWECF